MEPTVLPRLRLDKRAADAPAPFEIACICGAMLRGFRQSEAQTIRCQTCQSERFVLPRSPLPPIVLIPSSVPVSPKRWLRNHWPWLTAAIVLPMVVIVATVVVHELIRSPSVNPPQQTAEERFAVHQQAGQNAYAEGSCQRAATELKAALDAAGQLPGRLTIAERRVMNYQQRQAAIVADLLTESLAEIVSHAAGTPDAEWQAIFARRYAGRSIILDDFVHMDAAKQIHNSLRIAVPGAEGKIDWKALNIWRYTDLSMPQRMLLGFRLAGLRRESNGGWTILPEPDSGVFLTDPQLFKELSIVPDAEIQEVLKRQKVWLD